MVLSGDWGVCCVGLRGSRRVQQRPGRASAGAAASATGALLPFIHAPRHAQAHQLTAWAHLSIPTPSGRPEARQEGGGRLPERRAVHIQLGLLERLLRPLPGPPRVGWVLARSVAGFVRPGVQGRLPSASTPPALLCWGAHRTPARSRRATAAPHPQTPAPTLAPHRHQSPRPRTPAQNPDAPQSTRSSRLTRRRSSAARPTARCAC